MSYPVQIAIIGTAGRGDDQNKLNSQSYSSMFAAATSVVEQLADGEPWGAVSGGSAWADHIAVTLFLLGAATTLQLHLPCPLTQRGFEDTGERGPIAWRTNPGATLNRYHYLFAKISGRDPFADLARAVGMPGCEVKITPGLFQRNTFVARNCTHCVALTFGTGPVLKRGGTFDTMQKFLERPDAGLSAHIDLHSMSAYVPAKLR